MKRKLPLLSILFLGVTLALIPERTVLGVSAVSPRYINTTNTNETAIRNYYGALNSLSVTQRQGDNLLTNLKTILKNGHTSIAYTEVWDWAKVTDRNWALSPFTPAQANSYNFKDTPYQKLLYRSDNDNRATASTSNEDHNSIFNREHVWPKSLGNFGNIAPAGTDLHHLMLSDYLNNEVHSNLPYGNVGSNYTPVSSNHNANKNVYTGKKGTITYAGQSVTVYEPQDQDKGDIARAMFYMAARYSSYTSASDPYLKLTNTGSLVKSRTSDVNYPGYGGLLDTLIAWHTLDPVDDYEIHRNNLIYNNVQSNRNPFIDYPNWVYAIWGDGNAANPATDPVSQYGISAPVAPTSLTITPSNLSITVGNKQAFTVGVTPTNASTDVTWSSSNTNAATITNNGVLTAKAAGTTTITATSTINPSISKTTTVTVESEQIKTLTSISIANYPTSLKLKEDFDGSNIVVTAHFDDSTSSVVTNAAIIGLPDTNIIGKQTLTVLYTHNNITKNTTYDVRVTNDGVTVGEQANYATDLIFSEYIEGSGSNKYLEIYNGTGITVDLSDYQIQLFTNGRQANDPNATHTLSGTLAHNKTLVLKNSGATLTLPSGVTAITSTTTNFNGDDAIAIYKISTASFVDIFGIIGEDPFKIWGTKPFITENTTLVRRPHITQGITTNPTSFDPLVEWSFYTIDTIGNLGSHQMNITIVPGDATATEQAEAWAFTFLEITEVYCEDLNGNELFGALWDELGEEYTYMAGVSKALFKNAISNPDTDGIAGAKARYLFLVTKYPMLHANNFMTDDNDTPLYGLITRDNKEKINTPQLFILFTLLSTLTLIYFYISRTKILNKE